MGGHASTAADRTADHELLRACTGPTLDLGCGPGRFIAALAVRGMPALGLDLSAVAVQMSIQRGGVALQQDLFAPLPRHGRWARVMLADGNVGIGAGPVRLLRRAGNCSAPTASFSLSSTHPPPGCVGGTCGWKPNTPSPNGSPEARVGVDDATDLADAAGLRLLDVTEVHGRFISRMERA